jgi:hypothetical protein
MKISAIAAGVALCLAGFGGTVYAQQNSQQDSSGDNVTWIGSRTPSATESSATTRYEAESMLRQARQDCQREHTAQSRKDCLQPAQAEYKEMMASTREGSQESGMQGGASSGAQHNAHPRSRNSQRSSHSSQQGSQGSMGSQGSQHQSGSKQ